RYLFSFQAADGIRDFHVTGVQTCALPISAASASSTSVSQVKSSFRVATSARRMLLASLTVSLAKLPGPAPAGAAEALTASGDTGDRKSVAQGERAGVRRERMNEIQYRVVA